MAHEDWCTLVGTFFRDVVLNLIMEKEVARKTEYTSQLVRAGDACEKGYSSALREAAWTLLFAAISTFVKHSVNHLVLFDRKECLCQFRL